MKTRRESDSREKCVTGEFYSILFIFVFVPEVHPLAPIIGIPNRRNNLLSPDLFGPKGSDWNQLEQCILS